MVKKVKPNISRKTIVQYLQDYRYNSILIKNLIIILIVLIISFAVIMALVTRQMNRAVEAQVGEVSISALNKTQERMDAVMYEVVQISGHLSLDDDLMVTMLQDGNSLMKRNSVQELIGRMNVHQSVVDYIDSIYVYSSKNDYVITDKGIWELEEFADQTWYDNLTERVYEPGRMMTRLKENSYPYVISYIQPLRLTQNEFLGGIIVNIDMNKLDELVVPSTSEVTENLIILDERDNIVYSSNKEYLSGKANDLDYLEEIIEEGSDGYQIVDINGEQVVLTMESSKYFTWRYISTVPLSNYGEYEDAFNSFYVILVLFIIALSIASALIISFHSYKPVMNILNLVKNPSLYKNRYELDGSFKTDEIEEIGLNIIRNIYSNQQLQDEMKFYINTIDKAQLTALQAQLSPHFLFNTLENIRWRIIDEFKEENDVTDSIVKLSEMLRMSLDTDVQIVSMEEEILNAKLYVDIVQLRYGDKVNVSWDVDPTSLSLPIVKLSLQPIIENAIYHGIKPLREKGEIDISVSRLAETILIKVKDNGIGMTEEEVNDLNHDLNDKYKMREGHIGVRNVNQRLKLLIGDQAHLWVQSQQGSGTTISIEIPFNIEEV
jgi:two-component system sensor histidine kinase YesM